MARRKKQKSEPELDALVDDGDATSAYGVTADPHDDAEEEPRAEEVKPVEKPPEKPRIEEPSPVLLKVFARIAGPKWDQMAGFIHYARLEKMGPRTVPEWRAAHQAFLNTPMR